MKIVFLETKTWEAEYLKEKLSGNQLVFCGSEDLALHPDCEILCNFVNSPAKKEVLDASPNLKYIATRSTGFDHIDISECKKRGIQVSNVPTYGENTVAEFTFALLLTLSRKLYKSLKQVKEQGKFSTEGLIGFDLKGKTIGIVGTGHIGEHMVRMAQGFEMQVKAYDPHPKPELIQKYEVEYLSLEELLKQSDIVSLHLPYLPATHHILNEEKFKLLKPGAILLNTSRGGLVDTSALVQALKTGQVGGAGLDVLEEEGLLVHEDQLWQNPHPQANELMTMLADHELMHMENVIITPHNAFNSQEALSRILDTTVQNITAFIAGHPINVIQS
jgi:D-lactate dehydrogenase